MDFLRRDIKRWTMFLLPILTTAVISLLVLSGCDPAFEPLRENDRYTYSINGLLDASQDTQWVRIMEVRDAAQAPEDVPPPDAVVTLTHVESGETVVMEDSLLSFRGINTGERAQAYNYWTAMDIEPEQSYRLVVTAPDGQASDVTLSIPPDYPAPEFTGQDLYFDVEERELLADVSLVFYFQHVLTDEIRRVVFPKSGLIREIAGNRLRIRMSQEFVAAGRYLAERSDPLWPVIKMGVYAAYGGIDWPFDQLGILEEQDPDAVSNVNNGVGFVGGIVSHFIPICPAGQTFVPCPEEETE